MRRSTRSLSALALAICSPAVHAAPIDATRSTYLTRCGGCHGIEGVSIASIVPNLRNQVGVFLCTPEGRRYMLRVPNVAMSLVADDARLAAVMNFVIFDLGAGSTRAGTAPFTAPEIHAARAEPLRSTDLAGLRRAVLERAVLACAQG